MGIESVGVHQLFSYADEHPFNGLVGQPYPINRSFKVDSRQICCTNDQARKTFGQIPLQSLYCVYFLFILLFIGVVFKNQISSCLGVMPMHHSHFDFSFIHQTY